jgi:hypothetical protein
VGVEVKMTDAPGYRHAAGLARFLDEHPQAAGDLLYLKRPAWPTWQPAKTA